MVGRNSPANRVLFHVGSMPDCEPGLARRFLVFLLRFAPEESYTELQSRMGRNSALGQAHSPATQ